MSRSQLIKSVAAIGLIALMMNSSQAQIPQWTQAGHQQPVQLTGGIQPTLLPAQTQLRAMPVSNQMMAPMPMQQGYPQTGAALYPSPVPHVPYQVGMTLHTNQAFYPHEMLYKHRYKAMYPPFYYVVRGGWIVTPWGVRSSDNWHLEGTRVDVKYKTKIGLFSGFHGMKY